MILMNHSQNKGITLIELIVGISVLSFAIAGPMTLAASSLRATQDARNELVATHLAEEGIEVIHNIRDNNSSQDLTPGPGYTGWMNFKRDIVTPCTSAGFGCVIDVTAHTPEVWGPGSLLACTIAGCTGQNTVYHNPQTGLYRQSLTALGAPWVSTHFTRTITVTPVDMTREVQIISKVTYRGYGNRTREVVVSEVLYNWFPALH